MQNDLPLTGQAKGRRMLIGLVVFFALPIVLVLALHQSGWRPGGASHGNLLTPPQPLSLATLRDLDGQPFPPGNWRGKWSLVYAAAGNGGCTSDCEQQVYMLRQIHASLNKDIDRAQRVLLLPAAADQRSLNALRDRYPDLIVLATVSELGIGAQRGDVLLVDPLGNLIMRYPPDYDPKGLRDDLLRLLKYSWIG